MLTNPRSRLVTLCLALLLIAGACGSSEDSNATSSDSSDDAVAADETAADDAADTEDADTTDEDSADTDTDTDTGTSADTDAAAGATAVDVGLFFDGALATEPTIVDCTLSGGTETTCYEITVTGYPVTYDTGPFCPSTITDGEEAGGIWFDGNGVYDIDGEFIAGLAELYDDDNWMMYDEDGNVLVTETAEEFDLAARPDVDPSLQNHCVEGRLEWLENGEPVTSTVMIPTEPVVAGASAYRGDLGITLDGVVIAQAAPVNDILSAYTIAAFDDCGGHYNPIDGYHLHGAVGCSELDEVAEGETPMFAYAMDGFPVHSYDENATDLDECNGHDTGSGYHYHANSAAENLVIECLIGETATGGDAAAGGDGGAPAEGDAAGRPEGPPPGDDGAGDRPEGTPPGEEEEG